MRLVRFFGQKIEYWMGRDCSEISDLVKIMEMIEARELQNKILVASFPSMKKNEREKVSRKLERQAVQTLEKRPIQLSDLAKIITGG
jgi:hypothetical protein